MKSPSPSALDEFNTIFEENYAFLCLVSFSIVKDKDFSKDIVQEFFISFWQRRDSLKIETCFQAYAVRAVKNLSLQAIKKAEIERVFSKNFETDDFEFQKFDEEPKKKRKVFEALEKLPKKRREIFISAVLNDHSYEEIAESKEISINTVKTQIKRSYAFLRSYLREDFVIALGFLLSV